MTENRDVPHSGWSMANDFGGTADNAVQARDVGGGIHFHAGGQSAAEQRIRELTAALGATQQQLSEAQHELQRLRDYRAAAAAFGEVATPVFQWAKRGGYDTASVNVFMRKLRDNVENGPAAILHLLAFHDLVFFDKGSGRRGYEPQQIDDYFARVRHAMLNLMRREGT